MGRGEKMCKRGNVKNKVTFKNKSALQTLFSFKMLGNNNAQMICCQETEIALLVLFLTKLRTYLKGKTPSPAMPLYLPALLKWLS